MNAGKYGNRFDLISFLKSDFVKHSFLLVFGSAVSLILSMVFYPVFSRMYSPEEFGTFALFTSISGVASIFCSGVYEQAILLPGSDKHARSLALLALVNTLVLGLILLILTILFKHFIAVRIFNSLQIEPFLLIIPVSVLLTNLYAILTKYANRKKYYSFISQSSINQGVVVNISKLAFGIVKFTSYGLILGRLIGQFTSIMQLIFQVLRKSVYRIREIKLSGYSLTEVARIYKNFPIYNMPLQLMNLISIALPVFALSKYFTVDDAGQYSLAASVVLTPIVLLTGSVSKVLNQKVIESINNQNFVTDGIFRFIRIVMPVTGVLFFLFFFISESVFVFLFGAEWKEAGKISGILLPWVFLILFTYPISFVVDVFFKQRKALIIDIIYLVLRTGALSVGIYLNDMYLAIWLFVIVGCFVLTYNFVWYISLLKDYERSRNAT